MNDNNESSLVSTNSSASLISPISATRENLQHDIVEGVSGETSASTTTAMALLPQAGVIPTDLETPRREPPPLPGSKEDSQPQGSASSFHPDCSLPPFLGSRAPYIQQLAARLHIDGDVSKLHAHLLSCAGRVAQGRVGSMRNEQVAQIIDIGHPVLLCKPTVVGHRLYERHLAIGQAGYLPERRQVEEFLHDATKREENSHTRIIIIRGDVSELDDLADGGTNAAVSLLYAHMLGVELKLRPKDVALFLNPDYAVNRGIDPGYDFTFRPLEQNQASFGARSSGRSGCTVHWIESAEPRTDIVVIQVNKSWMPEHDLLAWASSTSSYAEQRWDHDQHMRRPAAHPKRHRSFHPTSSLVPSIMDTIDADSQFMLLNKSAHWLAAILQVEYSILCYELEVLETERVTLQPEGTSKSNDDHEAMLNLLNGYSKLSKAIQDCMEEADGLVNDTPLRDSGRDSIAYGRITTKLKKLHRLVKSRAADTEIAAEQQMKIRTLRMAQLSIEESRSAIALTFLAFFFVPTSVATSVFGMNVQEINGTGLNIWVPVVIAAVLTIVAAAALVLWRAWAKWMRHLTKTYDLGNVSKWRLIMQDLKVRAKGKQQDLEHGGKRFLHKTHLHRRSKDFGWEAVWNQWDVAAEQVVKA